MDGIFKQKLLTLRAEVAPQSFSEALLGDTAWFNRPNAPEKPQIPSKEVFSEKVQVLESLERFAQEKSQELNTNIFKIEGGEVHVRQEPQWEEVSQFSDEASLVSHLRLDPKVLGIILKDKKPGSVKAMFVSEKFRPENDFKSELKGGFIDELIVGFPLKTAELFERMIVAMKLTPQEVIIYPVEGFDETDYATEVMTVAGYFRPEVIITLGAKATSKILKSNDRLTMIHGQFFSRKLRGDESFQVVPLFHPSIIETNQNMKKTAWADMQIIMKFLKKIP